MKEENIRLTVNIIGMGDGHIDLIIEMVEWASAFMKELGATDGERSNFSYCFDLMADISNSNLTEVIESGPTYMPMWQAVIYLPHTVQAYLMGWLTSKSMLEDHAVEVYEVIDTFLDKIISQIEERLKNTL